MHRSQVVNQCHVYSCREKLQIKSCSVSTAKPLAFMSFPSEFVYALFLEVHWVVKSTWIKNIRLTLKSPPNSPIALSDLGVFCRLVLAHYFLSVGSSQNSWAGSTRSFCHSCWQTSLGTWPLPSPFLTVTSAEKQKPSHSLSTDKWGHPTFLGILQIRLEKSRRNHSWGEPGDVLHW